MAWMISLIVGTGVLTSRSLVACRIFGTTVGGGLFKTSLKCSIQRISCSCSDVNNLLFLSFTSMLVAWHLPLMILVILYTVLCSLHCVRLLPLPGMQDCRCRVLLLLCRRQLVYKPGGGEKIIQQLYVFESLTPRPLAEPHFS